MDEQAAAVESAVDRVLAEGLRTRDLGGGATTVEVTEAVLARITNGGD
jgi:isocitrate/isopropylmalate dehydrogenase